MLLTLKKKKEEYDSLMDKLQREVHSGVATIEATASVKFQP